MISSLLIAQEELINEDFEKIIKAEKGDEAILASFHKTNISFPKISNSSQKLNPPQLNNPQVLSIEPKVAWWGDNLTITGSGFDPVKESNVVHFFPIPVQAETLTVGQQSSQITVHIPEGARSSYPIVSASGIHGIKGSPDTSYLSIIAKNINLQQIRSVVEGRNTHSIYVGYYSNGIGTIASIDLYRIDPIVTEIDSGADLQPYLTRMISSGTYNGVYRVCRVYRVGSSSIIYLIV